MSTSNLTFRVAYNLHASARINRNIIPQPGMLTLGEDEVLTLLNTSNQQVIIQKQFTELAGVRALGYSRYGGGRAVLYVDPNEAYVITFFANINTPHDTMSMYQKLLQGDRQAAIDEFKRQDRQENRSHAAEEINQANADYKNFIAKARQVGVYKSAYSSAPFVAAIVLAVVVAISVLAGLLLFK